MSHGRSTQEDAARAHGIPSMPTSPCPPPQAQHPAAPFRTPRHSPAQRCCRCCTRGGRRGAAPGGQEAAKAAGHAGWGASRPRIQADRGSSAGSTTARRPCSMFECAQPRRQAHCSRLSGPHLDARRQQPGLVARDAAAALRRPGRPRHSGGAALRRLLHDVPVCMHVCRHTRGG